MPLHDFGDKCLSLSLEMRGLCLSLHGMNVSNHESHDEFVLALDTMECLSLHGNVCVFAWCCI